ncbi:MAG: hypothetical protein KC493_11885 [Bacteriovoracaceae bacterium]|nr:hypothetical protein [Bacteriovoracaceae bacterium]
MKLIALITLFITFNSFAAEKWDPSMKLLDQLQFDIVKGKTANLKIQLEKGMNPNFRYWWDVRIEQDVPHPKGASLLHDVIGYYSFPRSPEAKAGIVKAIRLILSHGGDPDLMGKEMSSLPSGSIMSPLHRAARNYASLDLMKIMIDEFGADPYNFTADNGDRLNALSWSTDSSGVRGEHLIYLLGEVKMDPFSDKCYAFINTQIRIDSGNADRSEIAAHKMFLKKFEELHDLTNDWDIFDACDEIE